MAETFDALLKVVIIGDTSVGKTCLILRYTQDIFRENFLSTIGVDFKTKTVDVGQKRFKLQIWDTAGQERYNTIRRGFYRGAKGVVIVYDITNPDSFANLTKWVDDITANCGEGLEKPVVLIVANKIDRELERKVAELTGKQVALEFGTRFSEVSAKTGAGVDEAFDGLVTDIARVLEAQDHRNLADSSVRLAHYPTSHTPPKKTSCMRC